MLSFSSGHLIPSRCFELEDRELYSSVVLNAAQFKVTEVSIRRGSVVEVAHRITQSHVKRGILKDILRNGERRER